MEHSPLLSLQINMTPVIYMVDGDGQEAWSIAMAGDSSTIVVVHKTNDRWMLRLGDQLLQFIMRLHEG